jgi:hypothetical protein
MSKWGAELKSNLNLGALNNVLTKVQMMQIGLAALGVIQGETQEKHIDQNGRRFKRYSKEYAEFRKKKGRGTAVDLTFTGHMMNGLKVLSATNKSVTIGFIDSTPARGGLRPSQKMRYTNKKRPWFGFGKPNSKRRRLIQQIGSEIYIEALTRRLGGSN